MSLSALLDSAQDALFALASCLPCAPSASTLKLNGRTFTIVKLLGEGGFSFVYLVRDSDSGRLFALKKIRCSYGSSSFREAIKEVEATKRFRSPNVIHVLDSCVVQDTEASGGGLGNIPASEGGEEGAKVIYIFLPFYQRGNLQDAIAEHVVRGTRFGEREMLLLFKGTCLGVRAMHRYRLPDVGAKRTTPTMQQPRDVEGQRNHDHDHDPFSDDHRLHAADESDQERPLIDGHEVEAEGAGSYPPRPTNGKGKARDTSDADGQQASSAAANDDDDDGKGGELIPYAHRDIKPGNVMLCDDGRTPVLMDFGSTIKARVRITSRREAVAHQDYAAERSSMPYRAPELFDVPTDCTLTESVDIWSLGCLLYALAYLHSPFETVQTVEQGGSIALAVLNGSYKFPEGKEDPYSDKTREVIRRCIKTKPEERPDIDEVIRLTEVALRGLE